MDENFLKEVSSQLRKPNGVFGHEIAQRMNESNQEMNLKTIHSLGITNNNIVVEVGMGNGFFVNELLNQAENIHYYGFDYSEEMVEASIKLNQKLVDNKRAYFEKADIKNLPLKNTSVDKLFTINTLYFWDDVEATISEIKRILKPNGIFCISIRPENCLKAYPSTNYNFEFYTIEKLADLLTERGFSILNIIEKEEPEIEVLGKVITPQYAIIVATQCISTTNQTPILKS